MSGILAGVAIPLGYITGALFSFRWVYGRLRARSLDYNIRRYPSLYTEDPAGKWNDSDREFVIAGAAGLAAVWPLLIPAWLLVRTLGRPLGAFLAGSPVRSRWEIAHEHELREARIAALEAENDRLRRRQARDGPR